MKLSKQVILYVLIGTSLITSCSKDNVVDNTETTFSENATLKTFKDITFSLDKSEGFDASLYFSTELGKSFKSNQIDASILPKIDIFFYSLSDSVNFFISPNDGDFGNVKGTTTLYINAVKGQLTIDQFNKIDKGADFDSIIIDADDDESFPDSQIPIIILFKNAVGKKGAIYVKSIHREAQNPRIVVDIKIQK